MTLDDIHAEYVELADRFIVVGSELNQLVLEIQKTKSLRKLRDQLLPSYETLRKEEIYLKDSLGVLRVERGKLLDKD
jgi:hypothetical protein